MAELNSASELEKATPMMQQYFSIKQDHQDCLLLYRMGDFYELFYQDAIDAAPILEITLTKRGKSNGKDIPMCGIPHHSSDLYIQRLIKQGKKIAICEQVETPDEAKKRGHKSVVKRKVVRIITPGTVIEDNLLHPKESNYLVSIVVEKSKIAIAYTDISTLEFCVINSSIDNLYSDLSKINPVELIIQDSLIVNNKIKIILDDFNCKVITFVDSFFCAKKATRKLKDNFDLLTIESLGDFSKTQIAACGSLLEYLSLTQKKDKILLVFPKIIEKKNYMVIDKITQNNLEIFNSKSEKGYSLLKIIDKTVTNSGGRLLRKFLSFPSLSLEVINNRLDLVEFFVSNNDLYHSIRKRLKNVSDIERTLAKIAAKKALPRDLYKIKQSLEEAIAIADLCSGKGQIQLDKSESALKKCSETLNLLNVSLIDREHYLNQEDFIDKKYNPRLAELYEFRDNSRTILDHMKREYAQKTGIQNLKIEFNNVLGYYIEVTKAQSAKIVCNEFIHRQTMVNNVRFVTEKLKELESKLIDINYQIELVQSQILSEITDQILQRYSFILKASENLAYLDVIISFAYLASDQKYSRPMLDNTNDFIIKDGIHPIVAYSIEKGNSKFIANDLKLNSCQNILLITGPNMSGKSTFLRQSAIIAIMSHIGSFVPASFTKLGLVDRIFSRIGAGDDLAKGHSTFLVEMIEAATILNQATDRSLIILDEIGRGTSTYDGIAIAWSCLEYLHNNIRGRTLFSTHYHELTDRSVNLENMKCYTVKVSEWEGKVIFMHKIVPGVASHSYGINVAEIAGIPKCVVKRSKEVLKELNSKDDVNKITNEAQQEFDLSSCASDSLALKIKDIISDINPDNLSPKEALEMLYDFKKKFNFV